MHLEEGLWAEHFNALMEQITFAYSHSHFYLSFILLIPSPNSKNSILSVDVHFSFQRDKCKVYLVITSALIFEL